MIVALSINLIIVPVLWTKGPFCLQFSQSIE
jgi:hypothetical protein